MMAPVEAVRKLFKKTGWSPSEVDLVELNEAFSVAAVAVTRELGLDPEKVNVNGGAVALGHAIGQSGSRLLTSILYELKRGMRGVGLFRCVLAVEMRSRWRSSDSFLCDLCVSLRPLRLHAH